MRNPKTMEMEKPSTIFCTVVAMDTTSFCYNVCSVCERALQGDGRCLSCGLNAFNPDSPSGSKLRYRVLLSIASGNKVFVVICFDRVARILFGCSANELFNFAKVNSFAAVTAGKILEGEMLEMTLSEPKDANAEHLRVTSITPLRSDFCPAIETLRKLYGVGPS